MAAAHDHHRLDATSRRRTSASAASDGFVRKMGREFLLALYGALRAVKLYPPENPAVQKALQEVVRLANELLRNEREARAARVGRVHLHQRDAPAPRPRQLRELQPPHQRCSAPPASVLLPHSRTARPYATGSSSCRCCRTQPSDDRGRAPLRTRREARGREGHGVRARRRRRISDEELRREGEGGARSARTRSRWRSRRN